MISSKATICQTLQTDTRDTESRPTCGHSWLQKEKGVKDSMKHFLVTLDIGEQAAIEAASSLYNSVTEIVYTATNMAARVNKVMNDLFKAYSEIEEETPIEKMIEEGNDDGFVEAEERTEENTEAEVQEDGAE